MEAVRNAYQGKPAARPGNAKATGRSASLPDGLCPNDAQREYSDGRRGRGLLASNFGVTGCPGRRYWRFSLATGTNVNGSIPNGVGSSGVVTESSDPDSADVSHRLRSTTSLRRAPSGPK